MNRSRWRKSRKVDNQDASEKDASENIGAYANTERPKENEAVRAREGK
jgi:hypothetical protein